MSYWKQFLRLWVRLCKIALINQLFISDNNKNWTVCGPVFQELRSCVLKHAPHVKFHDFDNLIDEEFLIDHGKIIIISQIGDMLDADKFTNVFKDNLEYYKQTGKKKNFFILLTAVEYANNEFDEFKDILKVYFIPTFYSHYNTIIKVKEDTIKDQLQYYFLSFNGRTSLLRTSLFCYFYRKNLLDKSIFSFIGYDDKKFKKPLQRLNEMDIGYYLNQYQFDPAKERYIPLTEIFDIIPYRIKNDQVNGIPITTGGQPTVTDIRLYNQTFCHLVAETYKGQHCPFFTEKIFKPIAAKQPFIVFGSKHSIKFLQDIGFKTFSPYINEVYDTLEQPARFNAILEEIDRIAALSMNELTKLKSELKSIVDYNYNHFYNTLPKMYSNDMVVIGKEVDLLIQQQLPYLEGSL